MRLQAARLSIVAVTALVPACGGGGGAPSVAPSSPAATQPALDAPTRQVLDAMLSQLETKIAWFLSNEQASLPMNPRIEAWIQAKIAMLQGPNLAGQIRAGRLYATGGASPSKGVTVPIVVVFPTESMRSEATEMVRRGGLTLPTPEGNTGWLALIDLYQLLGRDAMGREHKAIAR